MTTIIGISSLSRTAPAKRGGADFEVEFGDGKVIRVAGEMLHDPDSLHALWPFDEPHQFSAPDRRQAAWSRFVESQLAKSHAPEPVRAADDPPKQVRFAVHLTQAVALGAGDIAAGTKLAEIKTEPGISAREALMALRNPHLLRIEEVNADEPATATLPG
jgi:hypothetical protein